MRKQITNAMNTDSMDTEMEESSRSYGGYIAAGACALVVAGGIIGLLVANTMKQQEAPKTETIVQVRDPETAAALKEEVSDYITNYFSSSDMSQYINEDTIKDLTTMIMNSMISSGALDRDDTEEYTGLIQEHLTTIMNENQALYEAKVNETVQTLTDQVNANSKIAESDKAELLSLIDALSKNSGTDLKQLEQELQKMMDLSASSNNDAQTTLLQKIETLTSTNEADMTAVKNSISTANTNLSNLTTKQAADIAELKTYIDESVYDVLVARIEALEQSVSTIKDVTIEELKEEMKAQIDAQYLDKRNNGLVFASEKMKGSPLCAQITFEQEESVRSPLAMEAAKRMTT